VKKEKVVGKGKVVPPVKGKAKVEETKSADKSKNTGVGKGKDKLTQINKDTVYLEDVVKPRLDFTYSDWVCI
jgi:hypothetical protein